MAKRPIFIVEPSGFNFVRMEEVDFTWYAGMAMSRRQMSMRSLTEAAKVSYPESRFLEVSRMSDEDLGKSLSAFNLKLPYPHRSTGVTLECAFQASKVFERGGPYLDLLDVEPAEAKRDQRLKTSGRLKGFRFLNCDWPQDPPTAFYDWIYINALHRQRHLASEVIKYDIFTDIAFNPAKSINCQASAVALYVALIRRAELHKALSSSENFLSIEKRALLKDDGRNGQASLF